MLVCICRVIYEEDFDTPKELKNRIMEDDFSCGQCQLRYLRNFNTDAFSPINKNMKYWTSNIWRPNLDIESLEQNDYDAVILFCHLEFEFYNISKYHEILRITKNKNLKVYIVTGSDHKCDVPNHVEIIHWNSSMFKECVFQFRENLDVINYFNSQKKLDDLTYKYHFVYLNGRSHDHRSLLIDYVAKFDLLKFSAYSWHNAYYNKTKSYPFVYYNGATKKIDDNFTYELVDDGADIIRPHGIIPIEYYQSFFQLVSETSGDARFITEKTVLPLLFGKPFIIAGGPKIHQSLKDLGFELYDELFDYSFDNIENVEDRFTAICQNVKNITNLSLEECRQIHPKIQAKIDHNKNRAIELAYTDVDTPQFIKDVVEYYDKTSNRLDNILITTYDAIRNIKR